MLSAVVEIRRPLNPSTLESLRQGLQQRGITFGEFVSRRGKTLVAVCSPREFDTSFLEDAIRESFPEIARDTTVKPRTSTRYGGNGVPVRPDVTGHIHVVYMGPAPHDAHGWLYQ
jgi:hypothetical protein